MPIRKKVDLCRNILEDYTLQVVLEKYPIRSYKLKYKLPAYLMKWKNAVGVVFLFKKMSKLRG